MIGYVSEAFAEVRDGKADPRINNWYVTCAIELGIRIGLFECVVGYGGDIESGRRHRQRSAAWSEKGTKKRQENAKVKGDQFLALADEIWKRNPSRSVKGVAEIVASKTGANVETVRKRIRKSRPSAPV
jgi:hypothetical protein